MRRSRFSCLDAFETRPKEILPRSKVSCVAGMAGFLKEPRYGAQLAPGAGIWA